MSSLKLVIILRQCRYTEIVQRIFNHSDIQYINLTLDKKLNSLIYRTLFCVNIYRSYKLSKQSGFWPTLYMVLDVGIIPLAGVIRRMARQTARLQSVTDHPVNSINC